MTYLELYQEGRGLLSQAGISEADLDARLLMEAALHTSRQELLAHGERELSEEEEALCRRMLARRAKRVPLQQITGSTEFMGLPFRVNEHVMVPRQDTEVLAEEVLRHLHDGSRILDLCTGSGCILLSLLSYSNGCQGVGTDLSRDALAVAWENAGLLSRNRPLQVSFLQGDLFEGVSGKFEVIVSNPPYVRRGEIDGLMPEVSVYEPRMALDGGVDGLDFYRRIAAASPTFLCGGGQLFLEIGYDQKDAVEKLLRETGFFDVTCVKDFSGLDRVVCATLPSALAGK